MTTRSASGVGVDGIVGDEKADAVEGGQVAAEVAADLAAGADVEGGEGLVEEEKSGFGGQGAGEGDPLGLAARKLAGPVTGVVGQADPLQPRRRRGPGPRSWRCPAPAGRRPRSPRR